MVRTLSGSVWSSVAASASLSSVGRVLYLSPSLSIRAAVSAGTMPRSYVSTSALSDESTPFLTASLAIIYVLVKESIK